MWNSVAPSRAMLAGLHYTWTISPTTVLESRLGYDRITTRSRTATMTARARQRLPVLARGIMLVRLTSCCWGLPREVEGHLESPAGTLTRNHLGYTYKTAGK